ncbi:hypothetical protein EGY14_34950 [Burkholderia pseudomallei]|nr:hypothetical protein EGY14_34950 [Burkholderia pseudomallei]
MGSAAQDAEVPAVALISNRCRRSCITKAHVPPRYYLHAPIIGAMASQARHDSRLQVEVMIRGVLSPGLVGGW